MYFFQGTNYISPLVIYPLLLSITNPRDFGAIAIILSVSQFYAVIVDFGATTSGVERFVNSPSNLKNRLVKEIQSVKFLIILISLIPIFAVKTLIEFNEAAFLFAVFF